MSDTSECAACEAPAKGLYRTGCRGCAVRSIANGPEYFASLKACKLTPAYMARLQKLGKVEEVHAEVKAVAQHCPAHVGRV